MAKYTPAQAAAAKKYKSKFTKIEVRLTQDEKTTIEGFAAARGLSASQYVKECALSAGAIPVYTPPTIITKDKPQPPEDIAKQGGNALIIWLLNAGYSDEEIRAIVGGS